MSRSRALVALVAGVLAVVLGLAWWQGRSTPQGQPVPVWTTTTPGGSPSADGTTGTSPAATAPRSGRPSPSTSASAATRPAGCQPASPIIPTRIRVERMGIDSPVLSLGLADDGTVATPPFSQPRSVGWYNLGPRPGSEAGKVVLTAHTFHAGGALGNQLNDARQGIRPGDLVRVSDASGRTVCYRYSSAVKVAVADYDPDSTVIYDEHGRPQLALVICWDYQPATKYWASRIIYYADPV